MVEYIASQDRCLLNIEANYYNQLDIEAFSQMMKDPSYCYKFYWLEAVVHIISEGKNETTFDEIINEKLRMPGIQYGNFIFILVEYRQMDWSEMVWKGQFYS